MNPIPFVEVNLTPFVANSQVPVALVEPYDLARLTTESTMERPMRNPEAKSELTPNIDSFGWRCASRIAKNAKYEAVAAAAIPWCF